MALGRTVHTLQWDVARLPFDTTAILRRYPEVEGVTHAAIRVAVGRWARGAVLRWHRAHPDLGHVLIGETPLIGERLMELARPREDEVEPLLASERTLFVVPVPSRDLRRVIEDARASDVARARDAKSASPRIVRAHWDEIEDVAADLGLPRAAGPSGYDPELYAATYERVLRHRHVVFTHLTAITQVEGTRLDAGRAIVPSADEVVWAMRDVESSPPEDIERGAREWYRT